MFSQIKDRRIRKYCYNVPGRINYPELYSVAVRLLFWNCKSPKTMPGREPNFCRSPLRIWIDGLSQKNAGQETSVEYIGTVVMPRVFVTINFEATVLICPKLAKRPETYVKAAVWFLYTEQTKRIFSFTLFRRLACFLYSAPTCVRPRPGLWCLCCYIVRSILVRRLQNFQNGEISS